MAAKTRLGLYGGSRTYYARFALPVTKGNARGTRLGLYGGSRKRYDFFTIDDKGGAVMAWTIDSSSSQTGDVYTLNWAGIADASALTDQSIIDISSLFLTDGTTVPSSCEILQLEVWTGGVYALLEWDATTDDLITLVPAGQHFILPSKHPQDRADIYDDPKSTGTSGDIFLTTPTATANDTITIYMKVLLKA